MRVELLLEIVGVLACGPPLFDPGLQDRHEPRPLALPVVGRARGDHRPDSDYDIAVFIRKPGDLWDELGTLADITTDILVDTDAEISAKPFAAGSYRETSLFMSELLRDGLDL